MSNSRSGKTVRLTVAQAVVTYLSKQYSVADGERRRLIPATLGIFGHGNVAGLGQALDQLSDLMPYGGLKGSGIGKEGPRSAVAEMTDVKTVILHGRPG